MRYDMTVLEKCSYDLTVPLVSYRNHYSYRRHNLDGFLTVWKAARDFEPDRTYLQVFRNGIMESVDSYYINRDVTGKQHSKENADQHGVWVQYNEVAYLNGIERGIAMLKLLGVPPPVAAFITLTGVKGHHIYVEHSFDTPYPFARDVMLLPDILIEDYDTPADELLRPVFDAIWNEGGFSHCRNYDESGRHIRRYGAV